MTGRHALRISVERSHIIDSIKRCKIDSKDGAVVYQTFDEALQAARVLTSETDFSLDPALCCFSKRAEFRYQHEYRVCATLFPNFHLDLMDSAFTKEEIDSILA